MEKLQMHDDDCTVGDLDAEIQRLQAHWHDAEAAKARRDGAQQQEKMRKYRDARAHWAAKTILPMRGLL